MPFPCSDYTLSTIKSSHEYISIRPNHKKSSLAKPKLCALFSKLGITKLNKPSGRLTTIVDTSQDQYIRQYIRRTYGGTQAIQCILSNWKFVRRLGSGSYGELFLIYYRHEYRVLKYQQLTPISRILYEVLMQFEFSSHMLSPKIYTLEYWSRRKKEHLTVMMSKNTAVYSMIMMDRLDDTMINMLSQKLSREQLDTIVGGIVRIINKMCELNIRHSDMHWDNIGVMIIVVNNRLQHVPYLIDFGFSSMNNQCKSIAEIYQLTRTLDSDYFESMHIDNRIYLQSVMIGIFNSINKDQILQVSELDYPGMFEKYLSKYRPSDNRILKYVSKWYLKIQHIISNTDIGEDIDDIADTDYVASSSEESS